MHRAGYFFCLDFSRTRRMSVLWAAVDVDRF